MPRRVSRASPQSVSRVIWPRRKCASKCPFVSAIALMRSLDLFLTLSSLHLDRIVACSDSALLVKMHRFSSVLLSSLFAATFLASAQETQYQGKAIWTTYPCQRYAFPSRLECADIRSDKAPADVLTPMTFTVCLFAALVSRSDWEQMSAFMRHFGLLMVRLRFWRFVMSRCCLLIV